LILSVYLINTFLTHYSFSGNADDDSGNGFNEMTFNHVTLKIDRFNEEDSAYLFDDVDDYINTFSDIWLEFPRFLFG